MVGILPYISIHKDTSFLLSGNASARNISPTGDLKQPIKQKRPKGNKDKGQGTDTKTHLCCIHGL